MKRYTGTRTPDGCRVTVHDGDGPARPLPLALSVRRHSPSGFEWGYTGSGPAQLALAVCHDLLRDREAALAVYQTFKRDVVSRLTGPDWELTEDVIRRSLAARLAELEQERRGR